MEINESLGTKEIWEIVPEDLQVWKIAPGMINDLHAMSGNVSNWKKTEGGKKSWKDSPKSIPGKTGTKYLYVGSNEGRKWHLIFWDPVNTNWTKTNSLWTVLGRKSKLETVFNKALAYDV